MYYIRETIMLFIRTLLHLIRNENPIQCIT